MAPLNFQSKDGQLLLNGARFSLKGANFFGFETPTYVLHGLWSVSLASLLDFVKENSFNALRIPFSAELAMDMERD